jgi:DNA-binding transcriptional regulator LsrR (DeoR family)
MCALVKVYASHVSDQVSNGNPELAATGPTALDQQLLMAALARRYYFDNQTRIELAEEFSISRFKVARLLEAAVSSSVVRISIVLPDSVDAELSLRFHEKFGLDRALVATVQSTSRRAVHEALGQVAAALLSEVVTDADVLGVASGRTINATARHLTRLAGCEIVQLTGMSGNLDDNPVEVLRRVAEVSGGQVHTIYAPLTVATTEAAVALKTDPQILATFERFASVTIAVVAVGSWDPPESRYYNALRKGERERLLARGVIADVGGVLLDRDGRPVHDFDDRVLGVSAEQLAGINYVIAVGGGDRKVDAMRAALRSGLVNCVITDDSVALALLADKSG